MIWCDKCDWNVDPTGTDRPLPAWRQRLEHKLADTLYREPRANRLGPDEQLVHRELAPAAEAVLKELRARF